MRKMKRSDVHEWTPGEPIERVDFGNGCTGMNKSIPKEPGSAGDFKRLIWKCRAIEADGGPCLDVLPSEYWIDDVKQAGYYDVLTCTSNSGPYRFDDAWTYLNGINAGWQLARRKRHSGLYATLRTLRNGIFGSSAHRHRKTTGIGPLTTYSMVSVGTKSSGNRVFNRNVVASSSGVPTPHARCVIPRCGRAGSSPEPIPRRRMAACHDRRAAWRSAPPKWSPVSADCPAAHAGA